MISRRKLCKGVLAILGRASAPSHEAGRYCFVIEVPRIVDRTKIIGLRQGWTLTIHGGIEASIDP